MKRLTGAVGSSDAVEEPALLIDAAPAAAAAREDDGTVAEAPPLERAAARALARSTLLACRSSDDGGGVAVVVGAALDDPAAAGILHLRLTMVKPTGSGGVGCGRGVRGADHASEGQKRKASTAGVEVDVVMPDGRFHRTASGELLYSAADPAAAAQIFASPRRLRG